MQHCENTSGTVLKAVAIFCHMVVGTGDEGSTIEQCASVCLVDEDGVVRLSTNVQPQSPVTDYRFFLWTLSWFRLL